MSTTSNEHAMAMQMTDSLMRDNKELRQQAILRDLEIVRLREALLNVRHDVTMVSGCFMDSVATHGTQGGWLNDEAEKLNGCISEIDAALSTPIDLSALARHDEEIVGPWKKDAERYQWLKGEGKSMSVDCFADKYRVVDMSVNLVVTDWVDSFDSAIDAAIGATKGEKE